VKVFLGIRFRDLRLGERGINFIVGSKLKVERLFWICANGIRTSRGEFRNLESKIISLLRFPSVRVSDKEVNLWLNRFAKMLNLKILIKFGIESLIRE